MDTIGVGDFRDKVYGRVAVAEVAPRLKTIVGDDELDVIISVAEFLCLILLAAHQRDRWSGRLILYVTDNSNVEAWLRKRTSRNRAARFLLRLLQRLESLHGFDVVGLGFEAFAQEPSKGTHGGLSKHERNAKCV